MGQNRCDLENCISNNFDPSSSPACQLTSSRDVAEATANARQTLRSQPYPLPNTSRWINSQIFPLNGVQEIKRQALQTLGSFSVAGCNFKNANHEGRCRNTRLSKIVSFNNGPISSPRHSHEGLAYRPRKMIDLKIVVQTNPVRAQPINTFHLFFN